MAFRLYNSLNRKKESFEPMEAGKVTMYVCGPTVYDASHIGHARGAMVFDIVYRYLATKGYAVTYVRNFTDVDDKIIDRANQLGVSCDKLAQRYIDEYHRDMDALHILRPDIEPRATENIGQMITVIRGLIEKEVAYEAEGDVFFAVEKFAEYGKLSGRRLEDMDAGARVKVDSRKRNPFDFVLWKASKPGEPAWNSPWGKGRPGWHIECSAMSSTFLGDTIDIHGGGKDLTFPHHENEIAQSEAATGKPFVKYWVHNGFVTIDAEKMSKSLGNFLLIQDVLKKYHSEAVRLFLLSHHYRSPIDFSEQALDEAGTALEKIYTLLQRLADVGYQLPEGDRFEGGAAWQRFRNAMDDDFNTAGGVGVLFETVRELNRQLDQAPANAEMELNGSLAEQAADIKRMGNILGILNQSAQAYFDQQRAKGLNEVSVDAQEIEALIQARVAARQNKDWAEADRIRDKLAAMNVVLEDRPDGTVWKVKN